MNRQSARTWVEISRSALANNIRQVRSKIGTSVKLCAVVKANAYGHGILKMADVFKKHNVDWLAVFDLEEAISLREANIEGPILILGKLEPDKFDLALENNLSFTIFDKEQAKYLKPGLRAHLMIDTGLAREGVWYSDLEKLIGELPPNYKFEGVYSHLSDAENLEDQSYTQLQKKRFDDALELLESNNILTGVKHFSATDGLMNFDHIDYDMIRAGLSLYGYWTSEEVRREHSYFKLESALSWHTRIMYVKTIPLGTSVGYDRTETVERVTRLALLPVGYSDGYSFHLARIGRVLVRGKRCKIVGKISMNMMVVDVTDTEAITGDKVTLIGRDEDEEITVLELADQAKTVVYNILTNIAPIIKREYV